MQADDFAELYRRKQEAMLAELKSIYDVKNEWAQQLNSLTDRNESASPVYQTSEQHETKTDDEAPVEVQAPPTLRE